MNTSSPHLDLGVALDSSRLLPILPHQVRRRADSTSAASRTRRLRPSPLPPASFPAPRGQVHPRFSTLRMESIF